MTTAATHAAGDLLGQAAELLAARAHAAAYVERATATWTAHCAATKEANRSRRSGAVPPQATDSAHPNASDVDLRIPDSAAPPGGGANPPQHLPHHLEQGEREWLRDDEREWLRDLMTGQQHNSLGAQQAHDDHGGYHGYASGDMGGYGGVHDDRGGPPFDDHEPADWPNNRAQGSRASRHVAHWPYDQPYAGHASESSSSEEEPDYPMLGLALFAEREARAQRQGRHEERASQHAVHGILPGALF